MQKTIKSLFLFFIIVLSLSFNWPLSSYALTEQTSYESIYDVQSLEVGSLAFTNISFRGYSASSTKAFGLTGTVKNVDSKDVNYTSTAYYYDSSYNFIAKSTSSGIAKFGVSDFNQMSNLSILDRHSIDEVCYYRLLVSIDDLKNSNEIENAPKLPSKLSQYSSYKYVIDKYDVNVIVNENNTFDITETITAYFNVSQHGISRTIPLNNTVKRLDGTTSTNRAQIYNLSVDNEYTTSRENGNLKIKIGDKDLSLTGEQKYVIKYTYNIGKDPVNDYDELYYNIIGDAWTTVIGNVTFTVTMPKEFDTSKLGFSSGKTGSTKNSNVTYNVSENKITGLYNGILEPNEALTIRCELPEGYFVGAGFKTNPLIPLMFVIPVLGLIISLALWYAFGRNEEVIETVEFYPPDGFNSLEVGLWYKGKADNKDVTSLLVYLANKGYLKISETEEKTLFSKLKGFRITKLKDYDGNDYNEQMFLNGLFSRKHIHSEEKNNHSKDYDQEDLVSVTSQDLQNSFYTTVNEILSNINSRKSRNKILDRSSLRKSVIVILFMIISIITTVSIPTIEYSGIEEIGKTVLICSFYVPFFAVSLNSSLPLIFRVFWLVFTLFHFSIFFRSLPISDAITNDLTYCIGFIVGALCLGGMATLFLKFMKKRTPYGIEILGKLKGFKNFLETAEKEKLEALVMQDPTYFYNILPYTYVLGVSDKWIKKFESISLQAPDWYDSPSAFDVASFGSFVNSTMRSAQSAMISRPSNDFDGGGSSGGGFSGGGSGGGGGDSW